MRQPQLSSYHPRAWEIQWPPVNRFLDSCSFFNFPLFFFFFFSLVRLSPETHASFGNCMFVVF